MMENILQEIPIGQEIALPVLIATEPDVQLSEDLEKLAIRLPGVATAVKTNSNLMTEIENLLEAWKKPTSPHHTFFATDLTYNDKRNRTIVDHFERITALSRITGDRLVEGQVQQLITQKISIAFMMIADISDHNANTLIEAGIARSRY